MNVLFVEFSPSCNRSCHCSCIRRCCQYWLHSSIWNAINSLKSSCLFVMPASHIRTESVESLLSPPRLSPHFGEPILPVMCLCLFRLWLFRISITTLIIGLRSFKSSTDHVSEFFPTGDLLELPLALRNHLLPCWYFVHAFMR